MILKTFLNTTVAAVALSGAALVSAAPAGETAAAMLARLEAAPAGLPAVRDEGRKAAFFCANCHGETGVSRYSEVPNLAGQNPVYVLNQIEAFLSGKRKDPFMQGLMKVLSEHDKAAISLYYASEPVTPVAQPGARAAEGAALYAKLCARCHQDDARGGEAFPRLAGQQREYLRISLNRYLKQTGERFYAPMTAAVMQLGESNIEAVADHLAALK